MSNRKDRRRAASVRRHARPLSKADRRQLTSRVLILFCSLIAAMLLFAVVFWRG